LGRSERDFLIMGSSMRQVLNHPSAIVHPISRRF
jgi:hypothetical protein